MSRSLLTFAALFAGAAFGQTTAPSFPLADVHPSAPARDAVMQGGVLRGSRYEIRRATMLDLIRTAYDVDADTVSGGPTWLEWDRFDVIAQAPPGTAPATLKQMLQTLLADRFKLAAHHGARPMTAYALTADKTKSKLKPAASSDAGCREQPPPPPKPDVLPYVTVFCRGVTMQAFAPMLRTLAAGYFTSPVVDQTGLSGSWDFDLAWTGKRLLGFAGPDGISIFDAVDRQLGLKLEERKIPMPVLIVDRVNEKPTANLARIAALLPPAPPLQFEVASLRPILPNTPPGRRLVEPNGRVEMRGMPLAMLIRQAFDPTLNPETDIPGQPKWLKPFVPAFDLIAKAPVNAIRDGAPLFEDDFDLMLRAMLADRLKLATHYEDRPMDAYTLVAGSKLKLKKADPASRARCTTDTSGRTRVVTCSNITMSQFAEHLQEVAANYLRYPAQNGTRLEGGWNLTLTFSPIPPEMDDGGGGARGVANAPPPSTDPVGGVSLFNAIEKQLGLKLEKHQRPEPVLVIDHLEEKPTDN